VFFALNWSLEEHLQIIERVGPVRQAQLGTGKPCLLYYIVAKGTLDESVLERLRSKKSVQDILLEAMKRTTP
jgi:SNF2 family DNA or RNA helicase